MDNENIENEKIVSEKKKNKKAIIIVTSVIAVIVVVATSFLVVSGSSLIGSDAGKKNTNNKTETDNKTNDNTKDNKRELSNIEATGLIENIENIYNKYFLGYFPLKNADEITNQSYLEFAYKQSSGSFTKDDIANLMKKYFAGKEAKNENIICPVEKEPLYIYNEETGTYSMNNNHPGHGLPLPADTKVYFVSGTVTNEKEIEINTHVLYANYCGDVCMPRVAYYKSYDDSFNGTPLFGDINAEEEYNITEDDYNKVKDSLPIATYRFTKVDGNYSLVSVEIK